MIRIYDFGENSSDVDLIKKNIFASEFNEFLYSVLTPEAKMAYARQLKVLSPDYEYKKLENMQRNKAFKRYRKNLDYIRKQIKNNASIIPAGRVSVGADLKMMGSVVRGAVAGGVSSSGAPSAYLGEEHSRKNQLYDMQGILLKRLEGLAGVKKGIKNPYVDTFKMNEYLDNLENAMITGNDDV